MGKFKHGPLDAKTISQKLKWRGLQKLKFYCQLCEKQMRDDNGFKCHMMSEAHQRNLLIAADNPGKVVSEYSEVFHKDYMALLKRRWGTSRVHCNTVYCEYVANKQHYHMNATQWTTLTQYVKWLAENGHVIADFQDDATNRSGWYIQLIDRDPEVERRKAELERLAKKQKDLDERHNLKIKEMVERDEEKRKFLEEVEKQRAIDNPEQEVDVNNHEKINLKLSSSSKLVNKYSQNSMSSALGFKSLVAQVAFGVDNSDSSLKPDSHKKPKTAQPPKKMTALEEIKLINELHKKQMEEQKEKKENLKKERANLGPTLNTVEGAGLIRRASGDNEEPSSKSRKIEKPQVVEDEEVSWLEPNISIKVTTKQLGDMFYKKKGKILEVIDNYQALVQMFNTGAKVKLDQAHMETVIPAINRKIMMVKGKYKGRIGLMKSIEAETTSVSVDLLDTFEFRGKFITGVRYEMVSKYMG